MRLAASTISIRQLRAARALLNLKQVELAAASGVSLTAMTNIEREAVSPRTSTLGLIREALEVRGVEFTEGDGVRLRAELFDVRTFEGADIVDALLADSLATMERTGSDALWSGVDESYFIRHERAKMFRYYAALQARGLKERIILDEKNTTPYGPRGTCAYRAMPSSYFGSVNYGVYGDKYCLFIVGRKRRAVVIRHEGVAQTHRQLFEQQWKAARFVSYTRTLFDDDKAKGRYERS